MERYTSSQESHLPDFRALFNALPGLYLVVRPDDPRYTIVFANNAYREATLTSREEIAGRGLFDVFPDNPADLHATGVQNLQASLREVLATRARHTMPAQKYDIRRPESHGGGFEERYWSPVNSPLLDEDGEVQFIIHRVEDVTELVRVRRIQSQHNQLNSDIQTRTEEMEAELFLRGRQLAEAQRLIHERRLVEEKLRTVEARYSLAFAQAPIGMVLLSPDGTILEVNQAYLDSLGYTREELTAKDSSFFTHPDDVELTRRFFRSLFDGPEDTRSIEKRYFRRDGEILWARASATMRRDATGKATEVIAIVEDITARKRAEEQLWASQAQLQAIYDGTYEYIALISPDGTVLDCNRASLAFAGNTCQDVIGRPFWETPWFAATPGAPEALRQGIALAAGGQFVRYEAPLIRPSGEVIVFDFSLHPVRNERGEVVFLVPEGRDITEQNRAAKQIEDDRRRWRELLLRTPAAIVLLRGPEHKFDWVNPDFERLVGRLSDALIGNTITGAIPELEGQVFVSLLTHVYITGEPFIGHETPVRLYREDGTLKEWYLNYVYLPTRDAQGDIDGIFVHATDVTDMVLARKQIEESERQFRTLAETIPHLAWMADETGNRVWYNHRWYDYTGTTFDEVKGWGWKKVHDPARLPDVLKRWQEALSSGEPFELMYPIKAADGSFRSFLTRVEPVKDLEGRVVRWFGTNTDITDQTRIEGQLRRMNRELEEFAYVASHDLQEPLRMVRIYTQMILRNLDASEEKLAQFSAFIEEGVTRMEALIHDLLTFSRSVHTEELPVGTADLSIALAEAMSVLKGRIESSGAIVTTAILPEARGETSQMTHVFQNILSNALKYRKLDKPPEIDISAQGSPDEWIIAIRDNGIGFAPQYAERIFGLFKRLHKDEYPGTGLGLAICKRIVERYGGRIWAEGKLGEGATIYFSLLRAREA